MTRRVFIPQHPWQKGEGTADADLSEVMAFGHPLFMLAPGRIVRRHLNKTVKTIREAMFDFTADDFLLLTGDLVAQNVASMIAAQRTGGVVKLLRWNRGFNSIDFFTIDIGASQ